MSCDRTDGMISAIKLDGIGPVSTDAVKIPGMTIVEGEEIIHSQIPAGGIGISGGRMGRCCIGVGGEVCGIGLIHCVMGR